MSYLSFDRVGSTLDPSDLNLLEKVLERACLERDEARDSNAAKHTAGVLIRSFQRGITDPNILTDIARAVIRQPVR